MRKGRRNTLPRKSSPAGVEARFQARLKSAIAANGKGMNFHKPGSRNPRKVGR